jgi:hypothetical protein
MKPFTVLFVVHLQLEFTMPYYEQKGDVQPTNLTDPGLFGSRRRASKGIGSFFEQIYP